MKTLVTGLLIAAALSTQAAAAAIGRVKVVAGAASVVRGKQVIPAKPGLVLEPQDVLQTGPGGQMSVTFADNSRFAVGPNSKVILARFEFNETTHKGGSLTQVDRGSLAVVSGQIAKENKDAMKVRTPTSLLAARGTRFVVEVK